MRVAVNRGNAFQETTNCLPFLWRYRNKILLPLDHPTGNSLLHETVRFSVEIVDPQLCFFIYFIVHQSLSEWGKQIVGMFSNITEKQK